MNKIHTQQAIYDAIKEMREQRRRRIIVEENTRKVLVEKNKNTNNLYDYQIQFYHMALSSDTVLSVTRGLSNDDE